MRWCLCVDEKSLIQALSRSQPILPMLPGQVERRTHDYKRHGTTSLFAALDIATGSVIGECWPHHRAIEFRKFLNQIDRAVPAELTVHLVLDNYATHKTKEIRTWFLRHPRYHLHLWLANCYFSSHRACNVTSFRRVSAGCTGGR